MDIFFALILVCSVNTSFADCTPDTAIHGKLTAGSARMCATIVEDLKAMPPGDLYTKVWCGRGEVVVAGDPV